MADFLFVLVTILLEPEKKENKCRKTLYNSVLNLGIYSSPIIKESGRLLSLIFEESDAFLRSHGLTLVSNPANMLKFDI